MKLLDIILFVIIFFLAMFIFKLISANAVTCYALNGTLSETQTSCGLYFCTKGEIRTFSGTLAGSYSFKSDTTTVPPGAVKVARGTSTVSLLKGFFGLTAFSTFRLTDIAIIDVETPTKNGLQNDWNFSAQSKLIAGSGTGNFSGLHGGIMFFQGKAKFTPLQFNSTFNSNFTGKLCKP